MTGIRGSVRPLHAIWTISLALVMAAGFASHAGAQANSSIDTCVLGTWQSDPVEQVPQGPTISAEGLGGVLLSFDAGGLERADYSQSQPLRQGPQGEDIVYTFRGSADAAVKTANSAASAGSTQNSTVTQTTENEGAESFGAPSTTIVQKVGKGPGFLGAFPNTPYQCSAGTLTFDNDAGISMRYHQISGGNPGTRERPAAGNSASSSSASESSSSAPESSSSSSASSHDDSAFPWLPFSIPLVIAGPLIYVWKKQPKQPGPDSDVVPTSPEPACSCSGTIVIRGRTPLRVCDGIAVIWKLKPWEPLPRSRYPQASPVWNITLQGDDHRGGLFCARRYEAKLVPQCTGGGTITAVRTPQWTLQQAPGSLTLQCSVACVVQCPGQPNRNVMCTGSLTIPLEKTQPQMAVVVIDHTFYKGDPGHTAMRLCLGEYDATFGWYPNGMSIASSTAGLTGPGRLLEETSRDDESHDGLGPDHTLPKWYPGEKKDVFWFDVSAQQAERLRDSWLDPTLNLGKYNLYTTNCTTTVVNLVQDNLFGMSKWVQKFRDATTPSPWNLRDVLMAAPYRHETIRGDGPLTDRLDPFTSERIDKPND